MDEPSEYADVAEMIRHLRTLDEQSVQYRRQRDAIVERCLPLAEHIARRYRNRGEPLDDLIQTARMGLVHAVNRFNIDNGADFLAFAVPTVAGEVRRHFRDRGWAVKVPRRVKDLQAQLNKARGELVSAHSGAPPTRQKSPSIWVSTEIWSSMRHSPGATIRFCPPIRPPDQTTRTPPWQTGWAKSTQA